MKKKRVRVKKKPIIIIGLVILFIVSFSMIYNHFKLINSLEYKLGEIGYSIEQIDSIKALDNKFVDYILIHEYNPIFYDIFSADYYIEKNLDRYLDFAGENDTLKISEVIAIVNTRANEEFYERPEKADISKGKLMLVNKFNFLDADYKVDNLRDMSIKYAFEGRQMASEAYDAYVEMFNAAAKKDLKLVANSSYRDYTYQKNLYDGYENLHGKIFADGYAARPGHSEHQTGYAVDISTLNSTMDNFELTDEFEWLKANAHKYGFILRYPKGKEHITGYNYESWHYRYVGIDIAKQIKELDITFDEYYAYFIEYKNTK